MSRSAMMTLGFLLLFVGLKLNFVESYQLTPRATRFWIERIEDPDVVMQNGLYQYVQGNQYSSPYYQTSFGNNIAGALGNQPQKVLTPPNWVCWPVFFMGAFMLLNGLSMNKD
ncbi:MAG: hypothetical protein R3C03_21360 [Pirellulaceae bacterium]